MLKFHLKPLAYFLQIRTLATKSSKLVESTLKPEVLKLKIQQKDQVFLSEKEECVVAYLKKQHFSDTQIAKLVHKSPTILRCNVESILEPKLNFLVQNGFKDGFLTDLVVKNPAIFRRSLTHHLIPNVEYLRELLRNDQDAVFFVVRRSSWMLTSDLRKILQPNIDFLLEEGMEMSRVLKHLTSHPRSLHCTVDRMRYGVETVKKFGVKPNDNMFIYALHVALSMSELNWKKKIDFFTSLGWCDVDIASMIAHHPLCFAQSEHKLETSFDFFVKTMGVHPNYLMRFPKLLMYSLHKRIIPRCKVLQMLKEKKLIKDLSLVGSMDLSENRFTTRFIFKHPTLSSDLWILYRGDQKMDGNGIAVQQ